MARKRYTTEQIISLLREAEVRLSRGETIGGICRAFVISEQSYYRWRREYGGLKLNQAKRSIMPGVFFMIFNMVPAASLAIFHFLKEAGV